MGARLLIGPRWWKNPVHTDHCQARIMWGDGECECSALPRMYKVHDEVTFIIPRNPTFDLEELERLLRPNDPQWYRAMIWGDWDPPTEEQLRKAYNSDRIAKKNRDFARTFGRPPAELRGILSPNAPCPHPTEKLQYAGAGMVACGVCGKIVGLK